VALILLLRALGLGDLLTGVPALRALRRARPRDTLVLAAPAPLAPLARLSGAVDAVLPRARLDDGPLRTDGPRSSLIRRSRSGSTCWTSTIRNRC